MADQVITKQELIDAQKDAQTLEDAVNGEPGKLIKSRTGREFYSLASVPQINTMTREEVVAAVSPKANDADVYKKSDTFTKTEINALVAPKANQADVNAALAAYVGGRKAYTTLALAQAAQSSLPANTAIEVTNDGANNGTYQWNGTTLTKSSYDPLSQAKTYTNKYVLGREVESVKPLSLLGAATNPTGPTVQLEILGNHVNFTDGFYIGAGGEVFPLGTTRISDYIPVKPNDSFTITPSATYIAAVYDKQLQFLGILSGVEGGTTATITITQADAAFVRFNASTVVSTRIYANVKQTTLPWLYATPDNIVDALPIILNPSNSGNLLAGASFTEGGFINNTNTVVAFTSYKYTNDYIKVFPFARYVISLASIYVGVYFDESYNFIGAITGSTADGTNNFEFTTPANARYVKVNIFSSDAVQSLSLKNAGLGLVPKSGWINKTIAWYGTSIPAGYPHSNNDAERDVFSHANLAVHDLGGKIINKCVPAGGVGSGVALSFVRTTDAINYQNSLIDLIGTVNEPDLVVFDYGVNDYDQDPADINAFDPNDPFDSGNTGTKTKLNTRDTSTLIGAYNTIINAMLTAKPSMKFCFITHFSNDNANPGIATKQDFFKKLNLVIEALAEYWSVPVLSLHKKTNYRNRYSFNSITPAMPDHIHPASGNGESVESLRNIVRDFLVSIG